MRRRCLLIPDMWKRNRTGVAARPMRAMHRRGLATRARPGDPGGRDERQLVDPLRVGDRHLRGDEAAHRVAHQRAAIDPHPLAEVANEAAVGRESRSPRAASGWPRSPGRSSAITRWVRAKWGMCLQPVLPGAREAVDEDDRGAFAHLDVVDARADHIDRPQMVAPVDPQPLRVGIAVGVRPVGRCRRRKLYPPRRQLHRVGGVGGDPAELVADRPFRGRAAHARNVIRDGRPGSQPTPSRRSLDQPPVPGST